MSSGSFVASLIRRYEEKSERRSLLESPTSASLIKKTNNSPKVTNTSPRSVISKTTLSCISSEISDVEYSSLSDQLSSDLFPSREDIWVSSFDLDEEDSELIEEQEEDIGSSFDAFFPSPTFNSRSEYDKYRQEELDNLIFNLDTEDQPIFWPFENIESYKTQNIDKFLCVSPRRNILNLDISVKSGLDPIRVRLHQKSKGSKCAPGTKKRILSSPKECLTPTAKQAQQILNMPLRRLSSTASNYLSYEKLYPIKSATERNLIKPLRNLIQGGLRTFKENNNNNNNSIEKSIGLLEFDGHEGIEEHDGADNEIPLCGSPWQITSMMKFGMQRIKSAPIGLL